MVASSEALSARAIDILAKLVAFDTTSRRSNLALIEWVEQYLAELNVPTRRVPNADGTKSNLMAMIGPAVEGGVVLSGHTDVVPVDGQPWSTDPWTLTERDGRLYGRGTCDMKGFLALALAAAPDLAQANLRKPVHLAFSYDEEVGCLGAPDMIDVIAREVPRPALVVVGEPTDMVAVRAHKGIASFKVTVTGREAHSSLTHLGVSANMVAIKLMAMLVGLSEKLEREADPNSPFTPKGATLTIGQVNGGTAVNILARECVFIFDLRTPAGMDPVALLSDFFAMASALDAQIKAKAPEGGVKVERRSLTPAFAPEEDGVAEAFARKLAGDNGPARVVPYAAEAGQFQGAGFSTVICGPGSIDQAHQPNEYVEISQMQRGGAFMRRLVEDLST
ncbi:acetylornithine deacetylase [Caulobacter vibrioides]|uniref:Acetylornithine deacetylase n=2 Tax=Caulobacter vibrioides TaxID=155892 RepID=Q9A2D4_CAUVC|nr:acetylornithine deacetylase [Caulobacter vibrioides]YP_002519119.1 acetylornithine deacetylase [Caulobacter vibrioides NA1000]AAK25593.1 acetylornithine deacetylase [Caulobacter vibrioides CB15]ACL97211.1 acetylornithine deacetylase [Caulobacter vibrioides NA1000]ATC30434.1 acetylornithine deacetylase [Caulobacter vibrioides]QXZ51967.1 acetylornithine deacetylase [Caulobacter vibrioides]